MGSRRAVCWALDPIPSVSSRGGVLHRHCRLPAGHHGVHQSADERGETVHAWEWVGETPPQGPCPPPAPGADQSEQLTMMGVE